MADTIHVDQFLPRPPALVWRSLTEPAWLARWWAAGDIAPVVGHRFTLDMGSYGVQPCTVTEVEPERLLSYTFAESTMGWTLTWRLVPEGAGTRLFLEHGGFDLSDPAQEDAFRRMPRGWASAVLPKLARELESVSAP
jgi:uncharacterized protein YndB with AHSA1/START domain